MQHAQGPRGLGKIGVVSCKSFGFFGEEDVGRIQRKAKII